MHVIHKSVAGTNFRPKKNSQRSKDEVLMTSYQNNAYGYARQNPMGYTQVSPNVGMHGMGVGGAVYGGAPVVSFPSASVTSQGVAPPAPPASKPYYRCWDATQKKWFYWEKDSSATTWTEPASHITLIDYETGSIIRREVPTPAPALPVNISPQAPARTGIMMDPAIVASSGPSMQPRNNYPATTSTTAAVAATISHKPQSTARAIDPTYSAGVSRYTTQNADSLAAAAERARIEEADRLIAEKLQKELSMEAEKELIESCPLPGEAAKMFTAASQKKKQAAPSSSAKTADSEDKLIADMAESGFVVKKQKQKKWPATKATANP